MKNFELFLNKRNNIKLLILLLLIAGIEPNPGPLQKTPTKRGRSSTRQKLLTNDIKRLKPDSNLITEYTEPRRAESSYQTGILAQKEYGNGVKYGSSFIAASYVKFLEAAGARVVPILVNKTQAYYEDLFISLNGVQGRFSLFIHTFGYLSIPLSIIQSPFELFIVVRKVFELKMKLAVILFILDFAFSTYSQPINQRPIIGILAQKEYGNGVKYGSSFIAASYVKFLEAAGARVVPILVNKTQAYYEDLFISLNGVLFPGGSARLATSGYGKAGKIIFDLAIKANERGDYFPLWGTCLGFELLSYLAVDKNLLKWCSVQDVALPLNATKGNYALHISRKYPFYAVAWHPEKNQYEFVYNAKHQNIPHSYEAILISQYFANFFVNETRKNFHQFSSVKQEQEALIYKYNPVYTGLHGSSYEQKYFFNANIIFSIAVYSTNKILPFVPSKYSNKHVNGRLK
ncbi:gamma-glutamyl hydrolase-like [Centruroides sculpturatus]|uniref:gamma-glutamyl hydrolase-like n=1 Tax=Centruroides sculpturatus TaxID=218467 RepID=UPI000C6DF459|nr:gamma-glutamyl hydrolase-like [Centruroides sculpturatus]